MGLHAGGDVDRVAPEVVTNFFLPITPAMDEIAQVAEQSVRASRKMVEFADDRKALAGARSG